MPRSLIVPLQVPEEIIEQMFVKSIGVALIEANRATYVLDSREKLFSYERELLVGKFLKLSR